MKTAPLVSVCIPCFNAEKTIAKTLDSILAQTYPNIEIIISDNQSNDGTKEVVLTYEKQGVLYVENPPVKDGDGRIFGAFDNWDHALTLGSGEFLCLYHADDLYDPKIIEKELAFLLSNPTNGAVLTLKKSIDVNDDEIKRPKQLRGFDLMGNRSFDCGEFLELLLAHRHFISTPTLMIRKEVVSSVGKFNERDFTTAADLDYLIRISRKYKIGVINEKLHGYRITEHHASAKINKARTTVADYFFVMKYYIKLFGEENLSQRNLNKHDMYLKNDLARCAWYLFLQGQPYKSREMINSALSVPWVLHCMKSVHGIKVLGATLLVYVMTVSRLAKFVRR